MVLLAMSGLWWGGILGIVVLVCKFAPPLRMRHERALSAALVALDVAQSRWPDTADSRRHQTLPRLRERCLAEKRAARMSPPTVGHELLDEAFRVSS
jgi:hypothetical protein